MKFASGAAALLKIAATSAYGVVDSHTTFAPAPSSAGSAQPVNSMSSSSGTTTTPSTGSSSISKPPAASPNISAPPTPKPVTSPMPEASRHGGSLSWRNNNPGNIRFGNFAKSHGGVEGEHGFTKFPSEEAGRQAGIALLKTKPYQSQTVGGAIARWAPPSENDTEAYKKDVSKRTGFDADRPMSSLKDDELERMFTGGIQQHEGWKPGQ